MFPKFNTNRFDFKKTWDKIDAYACSQVQCLRFFEWGKRILRCRLPRSLEAKKAVDFMIYLVEIASAPTSSDSQLQTFVFQNVVGVVGMVGFVGMVGSDRVVTRNMKQKTGDDTHVDYEDKPKQVLKRVLRVGQLLTDAAMGNQSEEGSLWMNGRTRVPRRHRNTVDTEENDTARHERDQ